MSSSSALPNAALGDKYVPITAECKYKAVVRQGTAAICKNIGFTHVDANVLELLSQVMLSHITEVCEATKLTTENAGRTMSTPSDVIVALVDLGIDVTALADYFNRLKTTGSLVVCPPKKTNPVIQMKSMKVGEARAPPPYIPSWMPPFPDPHTYIKTTVSGDPDTAYSSQRELNAANQRSVDDALKNFMLRVHPAVSLYRKHETDVRLHARKKIAERATQMRLQRELRKKEIQKPTKSVISQEVPTDFLDDFMEQDGENDRTESSNSQAESPDNQDDELAEQEAYEKMFNLPETETSLLHAYIPTSLQLLLPKEDDFPYVTALLATELRDEGDDTKPSTPIIAEGRRK